MNDKWDWLAFISYKHDDIEMARWLQEKLERYKLPSYLADDYPDIRHNLQPIFRDETDLPLGYLDDNIKANLLGSQYLIVICSRTTPESTYVCDEIEEFISQGKKDKIIPLLLEGTPEECFPAPLLKGRVPLGANVNEISKEYALVKVIAALLGNIAIDKLWQRHLKAEEEEKERLLAEKRKLQMIQSRFLSEKAADLIDEGDVYTAMMLLIEALPAKVDDPYDRPLLKETVDLLRSSIDKEHSGATLLLQKFKSTICDMEVSHNGRYAAVGLDADIAAHGIPVIQIIEIATGKTITVANNSSDFHYGVDRIRFSADDRYLFGFGFDSSLLVMDIHSQKSRSYNLSQYIGGIDSAAWLGGTHKIALAGKDPDNDEEFRIAVLDIDNKTCDPYNFNHKTSINQLECSNDGKYIAFSTIDKLLCVLDVKSIKIVTRLKGESNIENFCFNPANSNEIAGNFASENCLFRLYIDNRKFEMISEKHSRHSGFAFSPDGHYLAYEESNHIRVADLQAKTVIPYQINKDTKISSVSYSQNGDFIIYGAIDGIYCIHTKKHSTWKVLSDTKNKILKLCGDTYRLIIGSSSSGKGMLQSLEFSYLLDHTNHDIEYATLSHDGQLVAYLNKDNALYITDTKVHKNDFITKLECRPCFKTRQLLFSSSDRCVASFLMDGSIYVHDLHTGESFHSKVIKEDGFENFIYHFNLPEDTLFLYIENDNAIASIIDEYVCIWYYRGNEYKIRKLDFKPDNLGYNSEKKVLTMVSGYEKGHCCKWFLSEDRIEIEELRNVRAYGNWIILENDHGYSFYNIGTEESRQVDVLGHYRCIVVSPDGKYAAFDSPYSLNILIIDLETDKRWTLERYSDSDITTWVKIYFEDSGHVLVSSCDTKTTRWFLDTGEKIVYKKADHLFGNENGAVVIEQGTLKMTSNTPAQEMIDKTRELFKDREFTDEEKNTFYLMDL